MRSTRPNKLLVVVKSVSGSTGRSQSGNCSVSAAQTQAIQKPMDSANHAHCAVWCAKTPTVGQSFVAISVGREPETKRPDSVISTFGDPEFGRAPTELRGSTPADPTPWRAPRSRAEGPQRPCLAFNLLASVAVSLRSRSNFWTFPFVTSKLLEVNRLRKR
jgi:hypothetical protein